MASDISSILSTPSIPLNARRVQASSAASSEPGSKDDAKIEKAGKDFESILLGTWLQQAENSFATVPGGDGEDDQDAGKDQFQGIAMQALAGSLTKSGGIGIAKMITQHLHSSSDSEKAESRVKTTSIATPVVPGAGKSF